MQETAKAGPDDRPDAADAGRPEDGPAPEGQRPPATLEGWWMLHQLFRVAWPEVKRLDAASRRALGEGLRARLDGWSGPDAEGWSGAYQLVGGGADLLLLHLRPSLEELGRTERTLQLEPVGDYLGLVDDYVSVVELGMYALTVALEERLAANGSVDPETWAREMEEALEAQRKLAYVRRRLYPTQPEGMPWLCYYPMDKRRDPGQNWYALPLQERGRMMSDHGTVGRRYAGRISQIISGSVGFDDWEWAVTLFGADPLDFKNVVTEMRYDPASAEYAEFGPFYVGRRVEGEALAGWFGDP